jgi:hypothetical protein
MLKVLNGPVIRANESLSEPLDCSAGDLLRLTMPTEWTAAPLTFQISSDGQFYNDAFTMDGYEVTLPVVVPGSGVIVPLDVGKAIAWIKFRSGSRAAPVPQEAERQFAVAINTYQGPALAETETPPGALLQRQSKPK